MKKITKIERLINKLQDQGIIKSEAVKQAMLEVHRGQFIDPRYNVYAYEDEPLQIGYNATISAPHMHAYALEYMVDYLTTAKKALDIGSGSGYLCAAMRLIMKNKDAKVVGVEHVPQLVEMSVKNLQTSFKHYLEDKSIEIVEGDGRLGYAKEGPFQVIHVGAAAEKIPQDLLDQLDKGGRMVIPVGQSFQIVDKDLNGKVNVTDVLGVRYVPLTDLKKQIG